MILGMVRPLHNLYRGRRKRGGNGRDGGRYVRWLGERRKEGNDVRVTKGIPLVSLDVDWSLWCTLNGTSLPVFLCTFKNDTVVTSDCVYVECVSCLCPFSARNVLALWCCWFHDIE